MKCLTIMIVINFCTIHCYAQHKQNFGNNFKYKKKTYIDQVLSNMWFASDSIFHLGIDTISIRGTQKIATSYQISTIIKFDARVGVSGMMIKKIHERVNIKLSVVQDTDASMITNMLQHICLLSKLPEDDDMRTISS